jgi:hypothetical protein
LAARLLWEQEAAGSNPAFPTTTTRTNPTSYIGLVADTYTDGNIAFDDTGIALHGYYFPWGTKHLAYSSITGIRRFEMSNLRGKWRIWGTGNFKYWAPLDAARPKKSVGYIINVGARISPFITPRDPEKFEAAIETHTSVVISVDATNGPFV